MLLKTAKKLIKMVEKSNITKLEIEGWWWKICIKKEPFYVKKGQFEPILISREEKSPVSKKVVTIKSALVGTFHFADLNLISAEFRPREKEVAFPLTIGQAVEEKIIMGFIEAMGIPTFIKSEVKGNVKKILVAENEPVEYGQELILLEVFLS